MAGNGTSQTEWAGFDELPKVLLALRDGTIGDQVHAAGLCAWHVTSIIGKLELAAAEEQNRILRHSRSAEYAMSSNMAHRWLVRFSLCSDYLRECFTRPVWRALTLMHEHPVRVGHLSGGSYIELAVAWAEEWKTALYPLELEDCKPPFGDGKNIAIEYLKAITEDSYERFTAARLAREIPVNYPQMKQLILIGLSKEMNRLKDTGPAGGAPDAGDYAVRLAGKLTSKQNQLLTYVWDRGTVPFEELRDEIWGGNVSDDGIEKLVGRTGKALLDADEHIVLSVKNCHVTIERPGGTK